MVKYTDKDQQKLVQELKKKGLTLESLIKQNAPVFTGQYRSLFETQVILDGNKIGFKIVNPQWEDKGKALEFGGEPGNWPDITELKKWVDRKINPENLNSVTYLIGESIKEEGIQMQPHVRPAIREFESRQ